VISGYNGIATVDEKAQIVVDAQAFGDGYEAKHVEEVIEGVDTTFRKLDPVRSIFAGVVVTADSEFQSEAATKAVFDRGVMPTSLTPSFASAVPGLPTNRSTRRRPPTSGGRARRASTSLRLSFTSTVSACSSARPESR